MTGVSAIARSKSMNIRAVVTRADGTVEDWGLICSSKPVLKVWIKIRDFFRGIRRLVRR